VNDVQHGLDRHHADPRHRPQDGDWDWDWERDDCDHATDPVGLAPTVPATRVARPDAPRLAAWSRPLCIVGSAALATVVALLLLTLSLPFELPTSGTNGGPARGPLTAGVAGPRAPAPTASAATTTSTPAAATTMPPSTAPRSGTITNVAPASASQPAPTSPPPTEPAGDPPPPPDDSGGGPLDDLLP
jgi:hypothetical protein